MGDAVAVVLTVVLIVCWVGLVGALLTRKDTRRPSSIGVGVIGLLAVLALGVLASIWVARWVVGS